MKNRLSFLHLLILALVIFSSCSKGRLSRKEMETQLKELKTQTAQDNDRIAVLEEELRNQIKLEELEREQQRLQADFEKAHREIVSKSEMDGIELSPPPETQAAPIVIDAPVPVSTTKTRPASTPSPEPNEGFSFTAVRTVPAPSTPAPAAAPAPQTVAYAQPVYPAQKNLSPRQSKIELLRQDLRDEINHVFAEIRTRRASRYGEKNGKDSGDTYIKNSTYDPETGENKKGGRKPKLAVDLETGLNQEFPEDSPCLDNISLSTTFLRARAIRDEIIELKNQGR